MERNNKNIIISGMAVLVLGLMLPLPGFSAPPTTKAVTPPPAVKAVPPPTGKVPPPPLVTPVPSVPPAGESPLAFKFDPTGKPDPFKPFIDVELALKKKRLQEQLRLQKQKQVQAKQVLSIFPLQRLAINQFKLVGIAGNNLKRTAMVQDPSGKFYPLFIGTTMGLNGAKVIEIREGSVLLEEIHQVTSGKSQAKHTQKKRIEMKLHQEGEEGTP